MTWGLLVQEGTPYLAEQSSSSHQDVHGSAEGPADSLPSLPREFQQDCSESQGHPVLRLNHTDLYPQGALSRGGDLGTGYSVLTVFQATGSFCSRCATFVPLPQGLCTSCPFCLAGGSCRCLQGCFLSSRIQRKRCLLRGLP